MKKVISFSATVMTVLMGCSFSKETPRDTTNQISVSSKPDNLIQEEIRTSSPEAVSALLKKLSAADLNQPFPDGTTSLEVAIERGNISIINLLIRSGASPFIANGKTNKSIFNEYLFATNEDKNLPIFPIKQTAVFNAISFTEHKIKHLIYSGRHQDFYEFVLHNNIPASVAIKCLSERSLRTRIPQDKMEKILSSPSFENDITIPRYLKSLHQIFFAELELQLNETLPSFILLEFISRKTPTNIYGYMHYDEKEDKTYFVNPGVLLEWRNIKAPPKHQDKTRSIDTLSNFPSGIAALYCEGNCKITSKKKRYISIDDLRNKEEFFNSPLLDRSLEARSNRFWNTTPEDET